MRGAEPRLRARLRELVEIESPSDDRAAVNRAADRVVDWARELDAEVLRHPGGTFGDVVELRFGAGGNRKPVLILGHLDTVYPMGTLATMPWREMEAEDGVRLMGPGVVDMKAGVVMALEAIAALRELNALNRPITLLLNPDEEVGSEVSRPHTERLARESAAVFVLEPGAGACVQDGAQGRGPLRTDCQWCCCARGCGFCEWALGGAGDGEAGGGGSRAGRTWARAAR